MGFAAGDAVAMNDAPYRVGKLVGYVAAMATTGSHKLASAYRDNAGRLGH